MKKLLITLLILLMPVSAWCGSVYNQITRTSHQVFPDGLVFDRFEVQNLAVSSYGIYPITLTEYGTNTTPSSADIAGRYARLAAKNGILESVSGSSASTDWDIHLWQVTSTWGAGYSGALTSTYKVDEIFKAEAENQNFLYNGGGNGLNIPFINRESTQSPHLRLYIKNDDATNATKVFYIDVAWRKNDGR